MNLKKKQKELLETKHIVIEIKNGIQKWNYSLDIAEEKLCK